jgi:inhibitor of cysteine peptidase
MKKVTFMLIAVLVLGGLAGGLTAFAHNDSELDDDKIVATGNMFEVILDSNASTGYSWVAHFDEDLLELIDQSYQVNSELIGAPGKEVFVFKALDTGRAQVDFSYQRPWENEPVKTETYRVTITPSLDDGNRFPQDEPEMLEVLAPVHEVEIVIAESYPAQYFLHVFSGLPNACVEFSHYSVAPRTSDNDTVKVEIINLEPVGGDMACAEIYRLVETNIPLGSDFIPGRTYTVIVNDFILTFVAQ